LDGNRRNRMLLTPIISFVARVISYMPHGSSYSVIIRFCSLFVALNPSVKAPRLKTVR